MPRVHSDGVTVPLVTTRNTLIHTTVVSNSDLSTKMQDHSHVSSSQTNFSNTCEMKKKKRPKPLRISHDTTSK